MRDGMIKEFSVSENMILREHQKMPYSHSGFLHLRDIARHTDELISKFDVKTPSRDTLAKNLSGGNIQKVVLARELSRNPRTIVAAQPPEVSILARPNTFVNNCWWNATKGRPSCSFRKTFDEILTLSDRIAVIYEGQIMDIVSCEVATPQKLGLLMAGFALKKGHRSHLHRLRDTHYDSIHRFGGRCAKMHQWRWKLSYRKAQPPG